MPMFYPAGPGIIKCDSVGKLTVASAGSDYAAGSHSHVLADISDAGTAAAVDLSGNASEFLKGDGSWAAGGGGGISLDDVFDLFYPVGRIVEFAANVDPNTAFARGTWALHGVGRVTVCIDSGQAEFNTVNETGGAKTHTLAESEIPAHTHVQNAHNHTITDPGHFHDQSVNTANTGGLSGYGARDTSTNTSALTDYDTGSKTTGITIDNATAVNQNTGGGGAHNNLQPYIVTYRWERTA